MHPQTVFDATELSRVRAVRTTTHSALASNLLAYLNRHNTGPLEGADIGGFAIMTRILGDRSIDVVTARNALMTHCDPAVDWDDPLAPIDLTLAANLKSAALAYDVLYDLLDDQQRQLCRAKIAAAAETMAHAVDQNVWWNEDLLFLI